MELFCIADELRFWIGGDLLRQLRLRASLAELQSGGKESRIHVRVLAGKVVLQVKSDIRDRTVQWSGTSGYGGKLEATSMIFHSSNKVM